MKLELIGEDARFLHAQLQRRLRDIEAELVHTDKHALQVALAADVRRMQRLTNDLGHLIQYEVAEDVV